MAFSPFSNDGGTTPNVSAVQEQLAMLNVFARPGPVGLASLSELAGGFTYEGSVYNEAIAPPAWGVVIQDMNIYIYIGGTNQTLRGNVANCIGALNYLPATPGIYTNAWFGIMLAQITPGITAVLPNPLNGYTINMVGYSQGAAVALLMGGALNYTTPPVPWNYLGFACPRAYAAPTLPDRLLPNIGFVIANVGDPVPLIPPTNSIYSFFSTAAHINFFSPTVNWRHITPIIYITPSGGVLQVDPGPSELTLTVPDMDLSQGLHLLPTYNARVTAWGNM